MTRVSNFLDQDSSREAVLRICSKFTAELLLSIDAAIGVEVSDDSEEAKTYSEFKEWLAGQSTMMAQSHVIGPILNSMQIYNDGVIDISTELPPVQVIRDEVISRRGRVSWLVNEIPSLSDYYGQLYDHEVEEAKADCNSAKSIDWSSPTCLEDNRELFERLDTWFMYAQPGYRIHRGDEDAQAEALEQIEKAKEFVKKEMQRRRDLQKKIDEGVVDGVSSQDLLLKLNADIDEIDSKMSGHYKSIEQLQSERNKMIDELERVEAFLDES